MFFLASSVVLSLKTETRSLASFEPPARASLCRALRFLSSALVTNLRNNQTDNNNDDLVKSIDSLRQCANAGASYHIYLNLEIWSIVPLTSPLPSNKTINNDRWTPLATSSKLPITSRSFMSRLGSLAIASTIALKTDPPFARSVAFTAGLDPTPRDAPVSTAMRFS